LKAISIIFIFLLFSFMSLYSQHEFGWIWPLKREIRLTGNYGELRPNHFHAGLDLATGSDPIPVVAIGNGYLYRVKSSTYGYGNALHIAHPNGYTSLYAHLSSFGKKVQAYIDTLRFHYQNYEVDCYLGSDSIFINAGDTIGYSGNTGASLGPHLHFEIRNTENETPINPLKFFKLYDPIKPSLHAVALVPMLQDDEIDKASDYVLLKKVEQKKINKKKRKGKVSKKNGKRRKKGGFDDDYLIDHAVFEDSCELNEEADYFQKEKRQKSKTKKRSVKSARYSKHKIVKRKLTDKKDAKLVVNSKTLNDSSFTNNEFKIAETTEKVSKNVFKVPQKFGVQVSASDTDPGGSSNNIYSIEMYFDSISSVKIVMDSMSFDDLRYVNTYLDLSGPAGGKMQRLFKTKNHDLPIFKEIYERGVISLNDTLIHTLKIVMKDIAGNATDQAYLIKWNGISARLNESLASWDCKKINIYEDEGLTIGTDANTFYYDLNPQVGEMTSEKQLLSKAYRIFSDRTQLHKWVSIGIRPFEVADSLNGKLCLVMLSRTSVSYVASDYRSGKVFGLNRKSGIYGVMIDTVAPKIAAKFDLKELKSSVLRFSVGDNLSGIKQFKLYLNGRYVQANHESKASLVFYKLSDEEKANLDSVYFEVYDNKGNKSVVNLRK
jgi:hypothetical protein